MKHYRLRLQLISSLTMFALLAMSAIFPTQGQQRVTKPPTAATQATAISTVTPRTPDDHNEIIKALMDNYKQLAQRLNLKNRKQQGGAMPTGEEVLQALLQINAIPSHTKGLIQKTLEVLPTFKAAGQRRSVSAKRSLGEIKGQLRTAKTTEQTIQKLQALKRSSRYTHLRGLAIGANFAEEMVRKGASTIYSPNQPFYTDLGVKPGAAALSAGEIKEKDIAGAIEGAIDGYEEGGVQGAITGAIAGAISASAAAAVIEIGACLLSPLLC
jgi:hypothetical protein